ncbi:MAG TPA: heme exporter protein CcmB [Balneolaceae bacterium]|nr:heme exporter protein CcmB [Balneolaceae bacterium]
MTIFKQIRAVFIKDMRAELRSQYAINTVLAFVGSSLLLISFSLNAGQLGPKPQSGILWIIILFAALSSLSRSFVAETEQNTFNLLRLHGSATAIYGGKLSYNFIFTFTINLVTFIIYIFFLGISVANIWSLIVVLILGSAGLASIATMLAAIVSQADRKGAIFSVLSVPLLFPLILILVEATKMAFVKGMTPAFMEDFLALVGFAGTTMTAGFLLFDFIWEE